MEDCIFCKLVKGEIPSSKIYEDDKTLAFLDINPSNKGHTLVITKKHYETYTDIPEEELISLVKIAQRVADAVVAATGCDGFNLFMNNKKSAGQIVPHVHLHIVPRFENDGVAKPMMHTNYKDGEMNEFAENIKKKL